MDTELEQIRAKNINELNIGINKSRIILALSGWTTVHVSKFQVLYNIAIKL